MRKLVLLVFDGVVAADLTLPAETFSRVRLPDGRPGYDVKICATASRVKSNLFSLDVPHGLSAMRNAETVVVPGVEDLDCAIAERVLSAIRRAAARGARIASVCRGAFVLARTGLLDGSRITTHWAAADALQALYPETEVTPSVLYVDNGQFLTSAGGVAQLDLCLHMIRCDYGAAVAASAARTAVMPLEREGGQAQFIVHEVPGADEADSLSELLDWVRENLDAELGVEALAGRAAMSPRSFARKFHEQTGTTPAKWVARLRVVEAQSLLETTSLSVERIGLAAGFTSAAAFRERFRSLVGVSPAEYRRSFSPRG